MPARKPQALITRHETAAEKAERAGRESAVRPERELPRTAPERLRGHNVAAAAWRRLVRLYGEIEGEIVTRMDQDILTDYCLVMEQLVEMDQMRAKAADICHELDRRLGELDLKQGKLRQELKEAQKGAGEPGADVTAAVGKLEEQIEKASDQYLQVLMKAAGASEAVVKLDSRVDRKRALLLQLRQSLYLTPRARAGVAPEKKAEEEPPDELEQLLGEVSSFMNSEKH